MQPFEIHDRLMYRRQFVLGPRPVACFPAYNSFRVGDHFHLTAHADLNTVHTVEGNRSLTLLGFILDPRHPNADDSRILKQLMPELCSDSHPMDFLQTLNVYGGRWILIANNGSRITVCNDALGQRPLYYTPRLANGEVWCGAQPGIIGSLLGLEPSRLAMEFLDAQKRSGQQEYWFPNDISGYDDIRLLLPNHYLDLTTAQSHRFWPSTLLKKLSLRHAVREGAKQLRGLMLSAANRFPLAVLMTAGWDSRSVLAAGKNLKTEVSYFTCDLGNGKTAAADISVPARLLYKLGKAHRVLNVPESMDPEFKQLYLQNVAMAHECMGPTAQALFEFLGSSEVRVSGSGSETVRQQFRPSRWHAVTAETLASFAWTKERFAIEAFGQWLEGIPKDTGFHILDLFYWEQKCGQWLAVGQVEWDLVGESFAPFNCRELLSTLLSTHVAYRVEPHYELYRALLKELWPEVLAEPINPHKKPRTDSTSLKDKVRDILVKSHLIEFVRSGRKY